MSGKQKTKRTKPRRLKGFRDITAADMLARDRMIARIRTVYERYGFTPLETPALEYVDVLGKFLPEADQPDGGIFAFRDEDEEWITSCVIVPTDELPDGKRVRLSDAQRIALDQLRRAIGHEGKIPPAHKQIPSNTACVTMAQFRTYCLSGGLSASNEYDAQQKAFKRAADKLLALGLIAKWQQYVWLTEKTDKRT